MKRFVPTVLAVAGILLTRTFSPLASQTPEPQALVLSFQCPQGDCPLLHGSPQTAGMRSGFVRLNPGETVGWHTTGKNEESLVILQGRGEARMEASRPAPSPRRSSSTFLPRRATTSPIPGMNPWNMFTSLPLPRLSDRHDYPYSDSALLYA